MKLKPETLTTSRRLVLLALAASLLAPALSACGKKADLEAPPGAPKKRTYPKPE